MPTRGGFFGPGDTDLRGLYTAFELTGLDADARFIFNIFSRSIRRASKSEIFVLFVLPRTCFIYLHAYIYPMELWRLREPPKVSDGVVAGFGNAEKLVEAGV
jgi:hypothetical protein